MEAIASRPETVNAAWFSEVAGAYAGTSAIVDALVKSENPEADIAKAQEVIANLRHMAENGARYTPDKTAGFGSDNSATIADKILGRSKSTAQVRACFKKVGKSAK